MERRLLTTLLNFVLNLQVPSCLHEIHVESKLSLVSRIEFIRSKLFHLSAHVSGVGTYAAGPWCADRAACYFMVEVEKLRRKVAYDRHFLLLGIVFSDLVRIRSVR